MTAETPRPRQNDTVRALLLMCLGVSMFPFLNTCLKLLTPHYSIIEIVWARFTGHFLTMIAVFLPSQGWRVFRANRPAIQIIRSFLLLGSTVFSVSGIGYVPLATAIGNTNHIALSIVTRHAGSDPRKLQIAVFDSARDAIAHLIGGKAELAVVKAPRRFETKIA